MFELLGVTLLQPEQVMAERLLGGADALASLVKAIQESLRVFYRDRGSESGARTLTLALGPRGRLGLWLSAGDDAVLADEESHVNELRHRLEVPVVIDGPVALALVYRVGTEAPPEAQLTLPEEWLEIVKASDTQLTPEQILTRLWSN
jgi:hypothetical protein